jgi:hypothetical protein
MTTPAAANSRMSVGIFCQIFERDTLTVANKFTSTAPSNRLTAARTDGHQCGAQRNSQNENWHAAIAEERLRKDSFYEGTDISGLRKKGPRRTAKADNCRADRRDC